jgi:hypothetical protein
MEENREFRSYDRNKVTNIFAVGEQIEWLQGISETETGYGLVNIYQTGIIKKINKWVVILEVEGQERKSNKGYLENRVTDIDLIEAIRASIGSNLPPKKSDKDNIPHDAYRLKDPRDKSVFYVGISKNIQRRYKQHLACSGLNFKLNLRIQEILQSSLLPEMELIEQDINGAEKARERERFWISFHTQAGDLLTNIAEMDE